MVFSLNQGKLKLHILLSLAFSVIVKYEPDIIPDTIFSLILYIPPKTLDNLCYLCQLRKRANNEKRTENKERHSKVLFRNKFLFCTN